MKESTDKLLLKPNWDEYGGKRSPSRNRLLFPEHRLTTARFVEFFMSVDVNSSVLDAGCGDGFWLGILRDLGFSDLFGVDLSYPLLMRAKGKGLRVAQYNVLNMSFHRKFDFVLMCDVFEHLPDTVKALNNIDEALEKNGKLYLIIPVYDSLSSRFQRFIHRKGKIDEAREHDETHLHAFSKRIITKFLESYNFQVIEAVYTANRLPFITGKIQRFTFGNTYGNWLSIIAKKVSNGKN